jgi:type I restriction-modification system DNA methylase subunit
MQHTQKDGSDVDLFLDKLFKALNNKDNSKEQNYISQFPYVNGGLFQDEIPIPKFNKEARNILEESGDLDWSHINPDIFGSMIQAVVNPDERGNLGMHYTSVPNIMKVIKPLFLDELYEELEKAKGNSKKLRALLKRICQLKIFDPACGSGNFLIIAYKELRKLEIEIWQAILDNEPQQSFIYSEINLTQFYGIEIDDFAHEIAKLSLWLAEHQMNKYFESQLEQGQSKPILPLKASGNITHANATRVDWEQVCPKAQDDEIYLLGNPPYLGYARQDKNQKDDMKLVFSNFKSYKKLDYITCWFIKGANFITNTNNKLAFVTTNSITQGEQVAILWPSIFNKNVEIGFAHTSFKWENNAKGNAGVSVVIIGLQIDNSTSEKLIYSENTRQVAKNINPYLVEGKNIYVDAKKCSISGLPSMIKGCSPGDNGNLLLTSEEKNKLLNTVPEASKFIKKYIGAREFMKGIDRYCIYVDDADVEEANTIPELQNRFDKVKQFRLNSKKAATQKKAETQHRFDEDKYQKTNSLFIPQTTSELREYVPIDFFDENYVISNGARIVYNPEPFIFGILSSKMHNVWLKAVSGKLETRIQYSNTICYNTFPFPDISKVKKANIEENVFAVLEEREKHPEKTMAELYDPDKMPAGLRQAHKDLDEAVERCYRLQPFDNDTQRLEYLFKEYEKMIAKDTLFEKQKKSRKKKKSNT